MQSQTNHFPSHSLKCKKVLKTAPRWGSGILRSLPLSQMRSGRQPFLETDSWMQRMWRSCRPRLRYRILAYLGLKPWTGCFIIYRFTEGEDQAAVYPKTSPTLGQKRGRRANSCCTPSYELAECWSGKTMGKDPAGKRVEGQTQTGTQIPTRSSTRPEEVRGGSRKSLVLKNR